MFIEFFREEGRERNFDLRNIDRLLPIHTPTRDQTRDNLGMCPDREPNPQPF